MSDMILVDGVFFKKPHENAPDFVKGKVSIKLKEFFEFAKQHQKEGWINMDLKVSKGGKLYFSLDTFEPKKQDKPFNDPMPDMGEIPF